jgi:hypothetical protein
LLEHNLFHSPVDFMEYAGKKMSAINGAWTKVKKSRGL